MRTVFKYNVPITGTWQTIDLPPAKPVLVAMQNHDLNVWVEVETELAPEPHEFMVTGTGHGAPGDGVHVGSTIDGEYVWHLWRRT